MSNAERLQAMEALWDALCHQEREPESPPWHASVLAERKARIESGQAEFLSVEKTRKHLQE